MSIVPRLRASGLTWVFLVGAVFVPLASSRCAADVRDEEAVRVYKQLKPSVVSLDNAEGSGTGIVVGANGLVLTNAHVVSSPLPFEMTVEIADPGGKSRTVVFKQIEVVGYHPRLDLALVRINPEELRASRATFPPAVISRVKGDPGQRVYVIGDPAGGDKVLTKTITSGMLSAVDREVDGERYYQTDAAINPGNSGGPMCDRSGKVLGLITFKFEDVQAIGFAIPLHDVDLKSFVALGDRKVEAGRAADLLKLADRFADLGAAAAQREGLDSPDRKQFNLYAAICYRNALAYDPGNPSVYYDVGMLLRTLDEDSVGAAYLARGIQLRPWEITSDAYRELGLSLAKQKKDDAALAAWNEGIAKFPYNSKNWEDLAIYHITHNQPADSAQCAGIALMIPEKDTRTQVMRQVIQDAGRQARGEAAKAEEMEKCTARPALVARLDELLAGSNEARKARRLYVTRAFAEVIAGFGGAAIAGAEQNIPQKPIQRHPALEAMAPIASGAASARSAPPTAAPATVAPAGTPTRGPEADSGQGWVGTAAPAAEVASIKPGAKPVGAGEDWLGPAVKPRIEDKPPEPLAIDKDFATPAQMDGDAKVTPLAIKDAAALAWSADGGFAFVLQTDGVMFKVAVPSLKAERQISLGAKCAGIGRCKQGLVVAVTGLHEVWLLDDGLNVKSRVPVPGLTGIAASPALPVVYAAVGEDTLNVLDMAAGRVVSRINAPDFIAAGGAPSSAGQIRFRLMAVTPDGRYLFCEGSGALHRLRTGGARLLYEACGPILAAGRCEDLDLSPDSRYVALPSGAGNKPIEGFSKANYATYVFRCDDLATPVITIESGPNPQTLAFDTLARCLYAQNFQKALIVFSPSGKMGNEYTLNVRGRATNHLYVHPQGKKLFVQSAGELTWVTLPAQ